MKSCWGWNQHYLYAPYPLYSLLIRSGAVTPDKATSWYFTAWGHLMSLMSLVFRAFILYPFSPWESTTISDVATRCHHLTIANVVRQRLFSPTTKAVLYSQSSYLTTMCAHTVLLCCRKWRAGNTNLVNYERSRKRGSVTRRKTGRILQKLLLSV